jgi:hypothetical protein
MSRGCLCHTAVSTRRQTSDNTPTQMITDNVKGTSDPLQTYGGVVGRGSIAPTH